MGQHHSNFELAAGARRAAERFDDCEIKVIRETFKDLCHLSGESTRIDKETFLQYFPLPGLLGERLFAVFDKKAIGEIDYEEFITGLAITCRGSWEEKVDFIFNIYDVHGHGAVGKEELAALLNHVPKSVMRFGKAMALEHNSMHSSNNMHGHGSMQHLALEHASMHSHRSAASGGNDSHAHYQRAGRRRSATAPPAGVGGSLSRRSLSPGHRELSEDSDFSPDPAADTLPEPSETRSHGGYRNHFESFTNNDMVEQALEECDLDKDGKLGLNEFRLWVERNPVVSQFLSSVFPYDEHRDWGDDKKHLPFIHNRDAAGSPTLSPPGSADGDGTERHGTSDEEAEVRRLLLRARELTRTPEVRDELLRLVRLLDERQASMSIAGVGGGLPGVPEGSNSGATSAGQSVAGGGPDGAYLGPPNGIVRVPSVTSNLAMSPRTAKHMHHQAITKQGFLSKQGHRFRTWKQRWYVLVGNCIYYYHHQADMYPRGVVFLMGSFVDALPDPELEKRGYWGLEITRNKEHRRKLFTRSKVLRDSWVHELRRSSEVIPIEEDFEIGEELGKGRFSRVCMCVNKHTLERKAVKIIEKDSMDAEEKELLRQEIAIMKLVNHPNIIRMEAVYESRQHIFIVMELHAGGELFDRIVGRPRFSEDEAFAVIYPLAESVAYLHEMGIVHRDLKPENILCGESIGDIKIADFGLSKLVLPDEIMKMPCGTLSYVAPEVLTLNGYSKEADIWSVGVIMYLLLRGRLPFDGDGREEIIENTINANINIDADDVWKTYSADVRDLVKGMLNKDTKKRYTAKDILSHPWITTRIDKMDAENGAFEPAA